MITKRRLKHYLFKKKFMFNGKALTKVFRRDIIDTIIWPILALLILAGGICLYINAELDRDRIIEEMENEESTIECK